MTGGQPLTDIVSSKQTRSARLGIGGGAQRRPLHAVVSALRVLDVRALPKQRLEGLLVFFVLLKGVDIHSVVDH